MRRINYPLIVSDFDGTLVNGDGTITAENKRAIAEYRRAGGQFVLSTGRLPMGILPRAKELDLKGKISCCQGAIIVDIEKEEFLLSGGLSLENTVIACKQMETLGLHIHAYDDWTFYSNMDDEPLRVYEELVKTKAIRVLDEPLSEFLRRKNIAAHKLLAMVEPTAADRVLNELRAAKLDGCEVTRSAKYLVEIISNEYSKGTAVEFLASYYGVPLEKTVAVGDQLNDVSMVQRAGVGIAVQNADEALKAVADFVTENTNEQSAIAEIIEKFGFYEE